MKKLIKITKIICIVLIFTLALFSLCVGLLYYNNIVTNFHTLAVIFKSILYFIEFDGLFFLLLYVTYSIYLEDKSNNNLIK